MAYPDLSALTFGELSTGYMGAKRVPVTLPTGDALTLTTPVCRAPFGVGEWAAKEGEGAKYDLCLSVEDPAFRAFLEGLDALVARTAHQNAKAWLNKARASAAVVEALCCPSLRPSSKPDQYAPTLKAGLRRDQDGDYAFQTYGKERQLLDANALLGAKGAGRGWQFRALLQCGGVWIAGGKCGLSWSVRQLKVEQQAIPRVPHLLQEYAFVDEEA